MHAVGRLATPCNRTFAEKSFFGRVSISLPQSKLLSLRHLVRVRATSDLVLARDRASIAVVTSTAAPAPLQEAPGVGSSRRKVVIAVDSTEDSQKALEWALDHVVRKGDIVHLAHVVSDPRTETTSVGATGYGTQWTPPPAYPQLAREYWLRLEETGRDLVMSSFVPVVRAKGYNYEVDIIKQRGVKSAAGIGEAICSRAAQLDAALLVVASHGAGVLADYGSVAQYCTKNCRVPVMVIPPTILRSANRRDTNGSSGGLMLLALDDLSGLERAAKWAMKELHQQGELLHAVLVTHDGHAEEMSRGSHDNAAWEEEVLTAALKGWVKGQDTPPLKVTTMEDTQNTDLDSNHSLVGGRLCDLVDSSGVRLVVLLHHGRDSTMREMMYGHLTTYLMRHCKETLVVIT